MRPIDADALSDKTVHMAKECFGVGQCYCLRTQFQKMIEDATTIDAVPVVRCGDCKWFDREEPNHPYGYCHATKHGYQTSRWEISIYRKCKEDFYCADGERKDG